MSLLITDLDNTLWDWFHMWHTSFSAMLNRLSELSGVPQNQLEAEIREVHQARATTEYSLLLDELPSLQERSPKSSPMQTYDEALHALNSARKNTISLYPGVKKTLREIKSRGVPVIAYTESISFWSEWRMRNTGLDGLIDTMYSSPDHDFPHGKTPESIRMYPSSDYGLKKTEHRHVRQGLLKPNKEVLRWILEDFSVDRRSTVYIGDSLMKDVAMAQEFGVHDVHAAYGVSHDREGYELLRRVSHWTEEDIRREKILAERPDIAPTRTAHKGFSELLDMFDFQGA
ncbi:HAD family hydrolase [Nocardiopsis lambiniae]|uniref:HAD family hydrolase n=1 Tax=Nocardiopsis lambiniae TaxID=3075539 RepID=A0ABU2M965_9ACTN|nr:HAD family hydrolase [Nocardiopsis sp. DSM 44743]MDT0329207.1 HAD family hydrolase [Nocardiopsis sp. DSM 44743]